jgi:putative addiction module killer protein
MIEIQQSVIYQEWYDKLRDQGAKARIDVRLIRLSQGNPGDVKPVGEGVKSCGSTMGRAIVSISSRMETPLSCSWLAG